VHPGGVGELSGWLAEGTCVAEPSGLGWPGRTGLVAPGPRDFEFVEVPVANRSEPFRPTYVPAATTKIARLRAASGRSHLSARPRSGSESGPNRSQTWRILRTSRESGPHCSQTRRMPCASSGPAVCSPARARRKKSVQAASSQAMASGRGRRSLAWMRSRPPGSGSMLAAALCRALRSAASRSLSVLTRHAPARFGVPALPGQYGS
jgi:hypothetical protein